MQNTVSASQVLFFHLEKEFLLLLEYVATMISLFTGDVITWELSSGKFEEYDTTRGNPSTENLPPG